MAQTLEELKKELQACFFSNLATLPELAKWLNLNLEQVEGEERIDLIVAVLNKVDDDASERTSKNFASSSRQRGGY